MRKRWWESKTVYTGIASIVGAAVAAATGYTIPPEVTLAVIGAIGIFLRDAIAKQ